jgi:predicted alpha/beta-fold hydrolase
MEYFLDFKPLIKSPYCQTIMGTTLSFEIEVPSKTHYVRLKDGDLLALEISVPKGWEEKNGTAILVHGLCGSHKSHYMRRITKKLLKNNLQVARVNLRGCGSGRGFARGIYHSGCSEDVFEALKSIVHHFPNSNKILIGFSLGGNVVLKLAGELQKDGRDFLKGVIAIGPPVDLLSSARLFNHPKNQIYAKYFLRLLLSDIHYLHTHFPDLPPHGLPPNVSMNDFDELYVAPRANFSNALEYYRLCSSKRVIPEITVPTKILLAEDDPIIKAHTLDSVKIPQNVDIYKTQYGGHIGFMGMNVFKEFRWMDNVLGGWIKEFIGNKNSQQ